MLASQSLQSLGPRLSENSPKMRWENDGAAIVLKRLSTGNYYQCINMKLGIAVHACGSQSVQTLDSVVETLAFASVLKEWLEHR